MNQLDLSRLKPRTKPILAIHRVTRNLHSWILVLSLFAFGCTAQPASQASDDKLGIDTSETFEPMNMADGDQLSVDKQFPHYLRFHRRDMLPPLNDPKSIPVHQVTMDADAEVLGITLNGVSRAYSIPALYYHHVVNDTISGEPIVIAYCGMCSSGVAFDAMIRGERAMFGIDGAWQGIATLYDAPTKSTWLHLSGKCVGGELLGERLKPRRVRHVLWKEWKRDYPNSDVVLGKRGLRYPTKEHARRGSPFTVPTLRPFVVVQDTRFPQHELLYGVFVNESSGKPLAKAYMHSEMMKMPPIIHDVVGATPIVIVYDKATKSAAGFCRTIGDRVLKFAPGEAGSIVDSDSQSTFNLDGICTSGRYAGLRLKHLFFVQAEWYGWIATYPETAIFRSDP